MGPVVGALVGPLVGALVDPLVGRGSLSPALCVAHQNGNILGERSTRTFSVGNFPTATFLFEGGGGGLWGRAGPVRDDRNRTTTNFEFISQGLFFICGVPPGAAPNAPSTQWSTERTQRFFICCVIKYHFDATSDAKPSLECYGCGCVWAVPERSQNARLQSPWLWSLGEEFAGWASLPKFCRTFGVLCEGSSAGFLLCRRFRRDLLQNPNQGCINHEVHIVN